MNVPYVKSFDDNGKLIDSEKDYIHNFSNRKKRRESMQKQRFHGNGKNLRRKQGIICVDKKGIPTGEIRVIEH